MTFSYKDYATGGKQKHMTIASGEFLRRFCMHILPPGFMKIRHYGFLSSRTKQKLRMEQMRMGIIPKPKQKADWKSVAKSKLDYDVDACPCCKTGKMICILIYAANAPPGKVVKPQKQKS